MQKVFPGRKLANANKMALHVRRDSMHRVESAKMRLKQYKRQSIKVLELE